jgi:hypothetical protein
LRLNPRPFPVTFLAILLFGAFLGHPRSGYAASLYLAIAFAIAGLFNPRLSWIALAIFLVSFAWSLRDWNYGWH